MEYISTICAKGNGFVYYKNDDIYGVNIKMINEALENSQ